jgi:5'-nucleotidase
MAHFNRLHGIFCNRTLNLGAIRAIGYDMDYTLVHYRMEVWENCAYGYMKERLQAEGWRVEELTFNPQLVMRGLVIDSDYGNVVKANRFGYVKRAFHGTHLLEFEAQRNFYQRTLVDLSDSRWHFLNTLFSISEACLYMQLVDLLDAGRLTDCLGYKDLYRRLRRAADEAHLEGRLKAEISKDRERFVDLDESMPLALLDQKKAGKKLLLITNSEWAYAAPILSHAFDRFLPGALTWQDLFDIVIIGARKPDFFSLNMPVFEVVSEEGFLREYHGPLMTGHLYLGGNAALVEESLGLSGDEILYVGDHIFVDVNISKSILRWRTALVVRELEEEISALESFRAQSAKLSRMMRQKEDLEAGYSGLRLELQRVQQGYGPESKLTGRELERGMDKLHGRIVELDRRIAPVAQAAGMLHNPYWGLLMRTGIDKSHLARQIERYADVYTSRVSNFMYVSPFAFLRSQRGSLPHDPDGESERFS